MLIKDSTQEVTLSRVQGGAKAAVKVVIFCGGLGLRLREYSQNLPKAMVPIGEKPIIWHLMKYYSHFGHRDFILCLGHRAELIKQYFIDYNEALSNDFVLSQGGRHVDLLDTDIQDWNITFVDTGTRATVGERLYAVRHLLCDQDTFLANYVDGLTSLDLNCLTDFFKRQKKAGCFISVRPTQTFHIVSSGESGTVTGVVPIGESPHWINGGYFVFSKRVFEFMREGEDLIEGLFQRMIAAGELATLKHDGFWACMDTFKERQALEDCLSQGPAPWQVWLNHQHA